jgi:hypothetical protein
MNAVIIYILNENRIQSFQKQKDRKVKQVLSGDWYRRVGEDIRKGYRKVNMKMGNRDLLKYSNNGGREDKGE